MRTVNLFRKMLCEGVSVLCILQVYSCSVLKKITYFNGKLYKL
jgi:hypothetical protein